MQVNIMTFTYHLHYAMVTVIPVPKKNKNIYMYYGCDWCNIFENVNCKYRKKK